jgi:hypothetical protein
METTKKTEFLNEINQAEQLLGNFDTFKHLFSDDIAESTLTALLQTVRKIRLYLNLSHLKEVKHPVNNALSPIGKPVLVSVRPVAEKYEGKTLIGFLLGNIALSSSVTISDDKIQCNFASYNPAIYVPETGEVIYGCESWWSEIKSEDDFRKITDQDIENVWYVKMFRAMNESKSEQGGQD